MSVVSDEGLNVHQPAKQYDIDLRGTCGSNLNCFTCHIIFEEELYCLLPPPLDLKEDLLNLAPGVTNFSSLGF